MKKRNRARAAALILAGGVLLGGSVLGGRDTARAVENDETAQVGFLVITGQTIPQPAAAGSPLYTRGPQTVHDKRTAVKAPERVEIVEEEGPSQSAVPTALPEGESQETTPEEDAPEEVRTYLGSFKITGYDTCARCCGNTRGITASGTQATVGRTCAAGKDLPFGTVLYIDGIGYRTVEDRGGGVNGGHIDVLCNDHSECYALTGHFDVYVVEAVE